MIQLDSLQAFYLIGALVVLSVALVYWADAIRDSKVRSIRARGK